MFVLRPCLFPLCGGVALKGHDEALDSREAPGWLPRRGCPAGARSVAAPPHPRRLAAASASSPKGEARGIWTPCCPIR